MPRTTILAFLGSALLAGTGAIGASIELGPLRAPAHGASLAVPPDSGLVAFSSVQTVKAYARNCVVLSASVAPDTHPDDGTLASCIDLFDRILAESPANGNAWATMAYLLSKAGETARSDAAILASWQSSVHQAEVALKRFQLIATRRDLPPALSRVLDSDLAVLAATKDGAWAIARIYRAADEAFRERVARAGEELPAEQRGRFVDRLKAAIRAMRAG